jgi:hypothetical protein
MAKSRSLTASRLFWHTPSKPSARATRLAVQRVAGAGQRGGAQRQAVDALAHVGQALGVARKHLHIGQQVVAKAHRLRHLQVGEAGHHGVGVRSAMSTSARCISPAAADQASISPRSHSRTSVATWSLRLRPVCSRLPASPTSCGQARLDVQVHVFQVQLPFEAPDSISA